MPFLRCGTQNHTQYWRWGHTSTGQRGTIPSFTHLAVLCLMHPWVQLALLTTEACCCLMVNLLLTRTPKSLSMGLFSTLSSPTLYIQPGLPQSRCSIQHLVLLNLLLMIAQLSVLTTSLCKASSPSRESIAPPDVVSSTDLFEVYLQLLHPHHLWEHWRELSQERSTGDPT